MDKEQTSQEEYEQMKAAKKQAQARTKKTHVRSNAPKKIKKYVITIVILAAVGYGFFLLVKSQTPQSPDFSQAVPIQGRLHVPVGSQHPPYNSNPPSSGWHYAQTTFSGWHSEPVVDEFVIHNLEHGEVWIAYHPRIPEEIKNELRQLSDDRKVVITPREANDTDIALVAWGRIDKFDVENVLDEQRIRDFIIRYKNQGPENVPPNPHGR